MTGPHIPDRILTQNIVTGAWLATALPVIEPEYGDELCGPGSFTGRLSPRLYSSNPNVVDPGNTFLFVESAGQLQWGGIVWDIRASGSDYAIEAASWSSYLQHRYDLDDEHGGRGPYTYADRCQVIRNIWAYAQSAADGDLGVTVDATTSTSTIGTPADPYQSNWWETPCLGDQIDDLVSGDSTPDYTCSTAWNTAKTGVVKRIRLGWPRLGARRTDLSFASGVNIIDEPEDALTGDDYAQVVVAAGAGEGRSRLRQTSAVRNGRLRMEYVLDLPDVNGIDILRARADRERTWRQTTVRGSVDQITVRDTPSAPFGSYQVGDDVMVRVNNPWTSYAGWCRITGWTRKPQAQGGPQTVLSLKPADSYQYGGV
ncbi:hypothetical protein D0Z67_29030 (plasmid) [Streptomyces seoulensis]|uniref:Uncharacterized protein n=1 Tax=Streptomyces seoulensis TaxID=73044 RepID=A0A4P6U4Z2_STRSO|nr:hypothetical protein [Streptomyces seoulensis]QBJ94417.1 hypothetical protein D0Z67_29030 [Streptomyces seoulensis]